eukprot:740506-Prorocentrum_lima.AAC.1
MRLGTAHAKSCIPRPTPLQAEVGAATIKNCGVPQEEPMTAWFASEARGRWASVSLHTVSYTHLRAHETRRHL